jgi:hypothetical protein
MGRKQGAGGRGQEAGGRRQEKVEVPQSGHLFVAIEAAQTN